MKELVSITIGAVERERERERESYNLINKKQSMKNALLMIDKTEQL